MQPSYVDAWSGDSFILLLYGFPLLWRFIFSKIFFFYMCLIFYLTIWFLVNKSYQNKQIPNVFLYSLRNKDQNYDYHYKPEF